MNFFADKLKNFCVTPCGIFILTQQINIITNRYMISGNQFQPIVVLLWHILGQIKKKAD
jgi:hypothetical protein